MNTFSKKDTAIVKSLAIIMMIYHHVYPREEMLSIFDKSFIDLFEIVSSTCKSCVSLLTILSGYGLYKAYKKYKGKDIYFVLSHYLKILLLYIPIYIIRSFYNCYKTINLINFYNLPSFNGFVHFVLDLLGLANLFNLDSYASDWFLSTIIVYYFLFIIIVKLIKKNDLITLLISFIPWIYYLIFPNDNMTISPYFYFSSFVLGAFLAKREILDKTINNKRNTVIISIVFVVISFVIRQVIAMYGDILMALSILYFEINVISRFDLISNILNFIGKQATNMWLLHYLAKLIVIEKMSRYSFSSFLIVYILTFCFSYSLSKIEELSGYNKLSNLLVKKLSAID